MKNSQVLDLFLRGEDGKNYSNNLHSENGYLFNYGSLIAKRKNGVVYINESYNHYSHTTQTHINYLLRNGGQLVDYYTFLEKGNN